MNNETGRPSLYTEELGNKICELISNSSDGLTKICRDNPELPTRRTIYNWLLNHKDFFHRYAQAKDLQADILAEEAIEIADDGSLDKNENSEGKIITDFDHINRSRLRVDTRKWLAGKLSRRYGERVQNEHTGKDGGPIETADVLLTDEQRANRITAILNAARARGTGQTSSGSE